MTEIWKPVPGYEEWYEVSNHGRVRSWYSNSRRGAGRRAEQPRLLKPKTHERTGYLVFTPRKNGVQKDYLVHHAVAYAFIGPRPEGMHINHKDGVKTNNNVGNLEYLTPRENMEHARDELGIPILQAGERHPLSKLTEKQVLEIRSKYPKGNITFRQLAEKYGVSVATISAVVHRYNWNHI